MTSTEAFYILLLAFLLCLAFQIGDKHKYLNFLNVTINNEQYRQAPGCSVGNGRSLFQRQICLSKDDSSVPYLIHYSSSGKVTEEGLEGRQHTSQDTKGRETSTRPYPTSSEIPG